MKNKILLIAGLLLSALGHGQTYSAPTSTAGSGGTNNVYVGEFAGANSTGAFNVFVGFGTGLNNGGQDNVFMGYLSGEVNTSGKGNIFIGTHSGRLNETGESNTSIGYAAGRDALPDLDNNSFYGIASGASAKGSENVCLGAYSGDKAGNGNVMLGFGAGAAETGDYKLYIDNSDTASPLIYGDFTNDAEELKFNAYKVGIGPAFGAFPLMTTIPNAADYRLFVRGGILAEEVRIRLQTDWADYVFADDYKLLSLKETEQYINENGHLPNMPSTAQVKEEGIEMGNIIKLQQEKIEELTLHLIEQDKKMEELKAQVQLLLNKQ